MDDLPAGFRVVSQPQAADDLPPGFHVVRPGPAAAATTGQTVSTLMERLAGASVAGDVAKALPTGVAKGAIGLAGLPGDLQEMSGSLLDRGMLAVGHGLMDLTGYGPQAGTPERAEFDRMYLGLGTGGGLPGSGAIRRSVEAATGPLYEPKTTPGAYAQTIGEFAPGALVGPGGVARKVAETVVPALASEAAGQATKGSAAEPVARIAGALAGNFGTAAVAARADAPARVINTAAGRVSPQQFDEAQMLAATGQRIGVPLTGAEAIQQATGGATKLGDVQRFVEGSPQSVALSEMMAARPGQMRQAVGQTLDTIGPPSAAPSTLGPRAAAAAQRSIDNSPEGRALAARILDVGPRTTAAQAGPQIQGSLRRTYEGREGVRAALADQDYAAARNAPETVGIDRTLRVERPGEPILTYPQGRPQFSDAAPRPLDPPPTAEAAAAAGPESLARFVARHGGIALDGDVLATDLHRFTVPGLGNVARQGGRPIDNHWRERLIEAGYLRRDADGGASRDITSELLRRLQNEQRGFPSYPIGAERQAAAARSRPGQVADEYRAALSQAESRLDADLSAAGVPLDSLHPEIRSRALGALMRGETADPLDAYERTIAGMREPPAPYVRSTTIAEDIPAPLFGQANPTGVVRHIDEALRTAKGSVAETLRAARGMMFTRGVPGASAELDLSVAGLQNARAQIGPMINAAVRGGDRPTASALEQVQGRLDEALASVPEHAAATRAFAAASEPLRPFDNPALAKVIERDEYGRQFVLPAERAAPTIEGGGPTAVRTFRGVAPPVAQTAFENFMGTRLLDASSDARGAVSGDRLALALRDNADTLDAVPGLRARLQAVHRADGALEPQRRGAIGSMSRAQTTETAGDVLLPRRPRAGGDREAADLVARLAREDGDGAAQLLRQRLADQADVSMTRLVGGEAQGGGARFAKDIAGTDQQERDLRAVMAALQRPAAPQAVGDMLDVFRATGTRKPQGSPTDFNAQYRAEVGGETLPQQALTALRTGGRSLLANAGDATRRAYLGRNNATLADILSAPNSVERIRRLVERGAETPMADAVLRSLLQGRGGGVEAR